MSRKNVKIIAIGSSTGGTEAIQQIVTNLPKNTPGIVIVQHMPAKFTKLFAERLNKISQLDIREAVTGDYITEGRVLIAPGGQHMTIIKDGKGYCVKCFQGEKISGHCPSVDVLFNSVAQVMLENSIGIILTGMGQDGAKGLLSMRKNGARTIGQDEQSCVVYGMPRVAFEIGAVEKQVPLDKIVDTILKII